MMILPPIYTGTPNDHDFSYQISTKFVFKNEYKVSIFTYNETVEEWSQYDTKLSFGAFSNKKILVNGQSTVHTTKCCVYFHKDGSTGKSVFNYWFQQIITDD